LVEEEFVATRVVAVADVNVASVAVSVERVARVAESEEKNPVVVVLLEAVRLVMTAFVVVELPMMRSVMVASVATREAMKELVEVAEVADRALIVAEEILVVARYELPDTVSAVAEAFPSVDVPEVSVEKTPVVNVGLGVTPIVEVEEKTMLDPAVR